jgi:hypothetical protein
MRFRKLRIAWSMACAVVAVSLMVLWVRSFWTIDLISRIDNRKIATTFGSEDGALYFAHFDAVVAYAYSSNSTAPRSWAYKTIPGYALSSGRFVFERGPTSLYIVLPHWLFAIATTMAGVAPWLRWRFGLRNLLIAMALVAVMLGLAVHFSTKPPATPRFDQGFGR